MTYHREIWKWDEPGRSDRTLIEPARRSRVLRPDDAPVAGTHPTIHQHVFGHQGIRHEHDGARLYHEHEPALLVAEVRTGAAALHLV